jgi:hypothetical protein
MLRSLSATPPKEPLARAVPAAFWYLRAATPEVVFRLADQLDAWGTPAANVMDGNLEERDLAQRYQTSLGLARTELGRALGNEVIESVALTGSDPYLREGSDLTAVFLVKQAALFQAALQTMLAVHAKAHGGVAESSVSHEGTSIAIATSPDGAIRQHRASVDNLGVVSNSLAATKNVLDAIKGKRPSLADEKDFCYMLARDADQPNDVLGFFGDKFVAETVGAREKVLEARRQIAAAELMTPGFAALLYGFIYGRSPTSVDELVASKLLRKDELRHAGGAAISFGPGKPARSSWGTPAVLTPLIDLPAPDTVSESERVAYERFSRTYETYWSRYIDPAALRLAFSGTKPDTLTADLRILPLIEGTDYREVRELAGQARVKAPPLAEGLRAVVGIGPSAGVRRELSELVSGFSGRFGFTLDFLGDWAMAGVADRTRLADIAHKLRPEFPEPPASGDQPDMDEIVEASRTPAYAAVGIRSTSGAALALAALRKMGDSIFRDMLTWTDAGTERGATIVHVAIADKGARGRGAADPESNGVSFFYALTDKTFLVSLDERVLRQLVADVADGRGPGSSSEKRGGDGAQLVVDLAGDQRGGLFTVLGWFLSEALVETSGPARAQAEALLRGAPERSGDREAMRALSLAYFGAVPAPPYGGTYTLGIDGVRDPARGTACAPRWPHLPVPGSMIDKLFGAVGRFRSEIAFDSEGRETKGARGMQSLHVRTTIGLRD